MKNLAVWKYPLGIIPTGPVLMQRGAKLLSVGSQAGQMTVWALVDTSEITVPRDIFVAGTGHVYTEEEFGKMDFIGTIFIDPYVWHIFDRGEAS